MNICIFDQLLNFFLFSKIKSVAGNVIQKKILKKKSLTAIFPLKQTQILNDG